MPRRFLTLLLAAWLPWAGAFAADRAPAKRLSWGERIARKAASFVGVASLKQVDQQLTDDCTGFVQLVFERSGVELKGRVDALYERAKQAGALHQHPPSRGDLVFFRETYDRNRDGKKNDGLTHVGVVEQVRKDGTVTFVHRGRKGVARSRLNLRFPAQRSAEGAVVNDYLRPSGRTDRAYTAGELCTGFATVDALVKKPG